MALELSVELEEYVLLVADCIVVGRVFYIFKLLIVESIQLGNCDVVGRQVLGDLVPFMPVHGQVSFLI